jgi:hypothetical protein
LAQELAPAQFDQLRRLLIELNATPFVAEFNTRPPRTPGRPRADG